jgi:hypothetical protein
MRLVRLAVPAFLVAVLLIGGCRPFADKAAAEKVAAAYFGALRDGDVDGALELWDAPAFRGHDPEYWRAQLWGQWRSLGDLDTYELASWWREGGDVVRMRYRVTYSRYPAEEQFALAPDATGRYRIVEHDIASPGLAGG